MENLPFLQLSQGHLQILETCPRKFQSVFLDTLTLPQPSLGSENQALGKQFHQLMQQRELGLEIQPLLDDSPQLQRWFQQFQDSPPPLITGEFRQSEYPCTLALEGFTLTAVFDLLIQDGDRAQIADWKTYRRPLRAQLIEQHWQTRLYLFMATEVLGYAPDCISMVYWFAEPTPEDRNPTQNWLSIPYSESMHQQTQQTLQKQLASLHRWMQDFTTSHQNFPQVPLNAQKCWSKTQCCPFVAHCHRTPDRTHADLIELEDLTDLAAITEISIQ
jgi:PD-(D/E)XK nuclease superfamily